MSRNMRRAFGCLEFPSSIAVVAAIVWSAPAPAVADSPESVVRVEEDWELVVATPDPDSVSPQITCAISPAGGVDGLHATFELNSQSLATFAPGGLQLQLWNGETAVAASRHPEYKVLDRSGETIRWTNVMRLQDGKVIFWIKDGCSNTWGSFGGTSDLRLNVDSELADLNGYIPESSIENSGVSYAGNRVTSLKRLGWRAYALDVNGDWEQVLGSDEPVVVHSLE